MVCCLKFFLLVSILLTLHAHLISAKQFQFKACWDSHQFEAILDQYCSSFFVHKRNIARKDFVKSELEAKSFLKTLTRREFEAPESQITDYYEECCLEGCKVEEVAEYCGPN